jgi:truncated hemoglobin YjbI
MGCCSHKTTDEGKTKKEVTVEPRSLYDQLGGAPTVEIAVDKFYMRVLSDDQLAEFFEGVNMTKLKQHQKNFITLALGGPNEYKGKDMRKAHEHLKVSDKHFDLVVGHLVAVLIELGVSKAQLEIIGKVVESTRKDVLNL